MKINNIRKALLSSVFCAGLLMTVTPSHAYINAPVPQENASSAVHDLQIILKAHPEWKKLLLTSIKEAKIEGVNSLESYYTYLEKLRTWIPIERETLQKLMQFYWILDQPSGLKLQENKAFTEWMVEFINDWGKFLDTPESAKGIETFINATNFNKDEVAPSPSGWMSFNQFFARQLRPGTRPVAAPCDNSVIVSPADSVLRVITKIDDTSKITAKGLTFPISDLLKGSPYKDKFKGGTFMHSYLSIADYHRFHVPLAGIVREVRNIPGKVFLNATKEKDGTFDMTDGTGYQFTQARGLIILESPEYGLVAIVPIGMGEVSSVVLTAEKGAKLRKGEEFGYFQFGGSDIIMLFEKGKANISAKIGIHYNQGQKMGDVK